MRSTVDTVCSGAEHHPQSIVHSSCSGLASSCIQWTGSAAAPAELQLSRWGLPITWVEAKAEAVSAHVGRRVHIADHSGERHQAPVLVLPHLQPTRTGEQG